MSAASPTRLRPAQRAAAGLRRLPAAGPEVGLRPGRWRPRPLDVLFGAAVGLLLAVHLTIFFATLVLAPVTPSEQQTLVLVQLPVEVARVLVLPFHALLLGALYVLGRRAAGRWAGFGSMLAVLALDLRADVLDPVYGPPTGEGGWIAGALIAVAFVLLAERPLVAAALVGAASGFFATAALALPAFLVALALGAQPASAGRGRRIAAFAGAWAVPAALFQLIWLLRLGPEAWGARLAGGLDEFRPHALVPWLEQQRIVFAAWHFAPLLTVTLASFLFLAAGTGVARYFVVPRPGEDGPPVRRVLARLPVELWAAGGMVVTTSVWWGLSGDTTVVVPTLPALAAATPLLTALAYRGAKWLLTVNRFWKLCAVLYLVGLILARTTQLLITLVQAFQH